jgi:hypothetical protein
MMCRSAGDLARPSAARSITRDALQNTESVASVRWSSYDRSPVTRSAVTWSDLPFCAPSRRCGVLARLA